MSAPAAWAALALAGLLDVAWAASMKLAQGYSRPGWTVLSLVLLGAFVWLLGKALQALPMGVAYAVWTGIGAVGTVLVGRLWFDERLSLMSVAGVGLVCVGIAVLKLSQGG